MTYSRRLRLEVDREQQSKENKFHAIMMTNDSKQLEVVMNQSDFVSADTSRTRIEANYAPPAQ